MLRTTSFEKGMRVFSQAEEYFMYNPSMVALNQYDKPLAKAAPVIPSLKLKVKAQQRGTWKHSVAQEVKSIGTIKP